MIYIAKGTTPLDSEFYDHFKLVNQMQKKLNKLLSELCTGWGFCIPEKEAIKFFEQENIEADQFACAILTAEGMNPEIEVEWRRKIRNRFIEVYGSRFS